VHSHETYQLARNLSTRSKIKFPRGLNVAFHSWQPPDDHIMLNPSSVDGFPRLRHARRQRIPSIIKA
jgi:hypothetical protein